MDRNLEKLAEQTWAKLLARIGVPFFVTLVLPLTGWLGLQYLIGLQDKMQVQINLLNGQLGEIKADRVDRQKQQAEIVRSLNSTLNDVQRTMGIIQQKLENMDDRQDRSDTRIDRLEQRSMDASRVR